jgi:hypothetical protein
MTLRDRIPSLLDLARLEAFDMSPAKLGERVIEKNLILARGNLK